MPSDADIVHVVDDDEAMRDSMAFLLRAENFQVRTYADATDFLNALPQIKVGCVVTDVRMPGMSGIELLQRLRELKVSVPVIVSLRPRRCAACSRSHEDRGFGLYREAL